MNMSNFEDRETLQRVIENRRSIEGRELSDHEVAAAQSLLDHPQFDTMLVDDRRAFYQSQLTRRSGISSSESGDSLPAAADSMPLMGWLLLAAGLIVTCISFFLRTSISSAAGGDIIGDTYIPRTTSSVINIGMLQTQMMVFQIGLALAIGGLLLICAAAIRSALVRLGSQAPSEG
jgi:hypothetical protein